MLFGAPKFVTFDLLSFELSVHFVDIKSGKERYLFSRQKWCPSAASLLKIKFRDDGGSSSIRSDVFAPENCQAIPTLDNSSLTVSRCLVTFKKNIGHRVSTHPCIRLRSG